MSQGQIVLVTGCSEGGVGNTMCMEFASRGCKVYATARKVDKMNNLVGVPNIELMALDVTDSTNVVSVVEDIITREGRVDVLVNNAGLACFGPILEVPVDQIREVYDTNILSIIRTSRAVMPHMAARKSGTIVTIGSIVGEIPTPWAGVYASSKAAAHTITEVLQMECRPFDIKVLLICPGGIKTNVAENASARFALPEDSLYKVYLDTIVKRMWASQVPTSLTAEEFARIVVDKTFKKGAPFYSTMGSHSAVFALFKWLPRMWALNFMWKTYGKVTPK
ncbi:NAD-P-binding protein [Roridomyces roridus]|uniref:NAD-P-binding protein n=1 Tax=Roridomyces roridus TaxID=1738132 RepID=A0AAD7FB43_9AGAR|nr:NAD-P-binding protein [Roridomyces roridus]